MTYPQQPPVPQGPGAYPFPGPGGAPRRRVAPWRHVLYVLVQIALWSTIVFLLIVTWVAVEMAMEDGHDSFETTLYWAMVAVVVVMAVGCYLLTRAARRIDGSHPSQVRRQVEQAAGMAQPEIEAQQVWGVGPIAEAAQPQIPSQAQVPPLTPSQPPQNPTPQAPDPRFPYGRPSS